MSEPQCLVGTGIITLPLEALEDILVFLAFDGHIASVSSFAQTCRKFRQFIYDPLDKHLWRRIFLSTFDDPRKSESANDDFGSFDWGEETRKRICAAIRLKPRNVTADPRLTPYRLRSEERNSALTSNSRDFTAHLLVLGSVIATAKPLPYSLTDSARAPDLDELSKMSLVEAHGKYPVEPPAVERKPGDSEESKNVIWLRSVLDNGLPCEVACRFGHSRIDKAWTASDEAQALHHLVAHVGIRSLLSSPNAGEKAIATQRWRFRDSFQWLKLNQHARNDLSRYIAQSRVYNMSYPKGRRAWGPFLPVVPAGANDAVAQPEDKNDSRSDHSDESDEEYHPPGELDDETPCPEMLYPDWVHLAAIRLVVESRLRDMESSQIVELADRLATMDGWRAGAWAPLHPPDELRSDSVETAINWDWAGVEGVWQRCVCWLGYAQLAMHNRNNFRDEMLEVMIIVPLTIRIVGYSPCTVPGYERYPTIQLEGQMGGGDWVPSHDTRRTYGTVGIIADGSVRWSMLSAEEGAPDENEWLSEGVQMGGIGSTSGVLGLWTGAEHEPRDPIGAWWQWRVA